MKKSAREIMEIFEAFDKTGSAHSAARLAGVDPKTVRRLVAARDAGAPVAEPGRRERIIDPFQPKIEEWVDHSEGLVRADKVHERLLVLGFTGDERTTRRAVHEAKVRWRAGHRPPASAASPPLRAGHGLRLPDLLAGHRRPVHRLRENARTRCTACVRLCLA